MTLSYINVALSKDKPEIYTSDLEMENVFIDHELNLILSVYNRSNRMLCLHNKDTADTTFRCYTEQHPQVEDGPPFVRPLLNFLWLLLLAIDG